MATPQPPIIRAGLEQEPIRVAAAHWNLEAAVLTEHARALTLKLGRRTAHSDWVALRGATMLTRPWSNASTRLA